MDTLRDKRKDAAIDISHYGYNIRSTLEGGQFGDLLVRFEFYHKIKGPRFLGTTTPLRRLIRSVRRVPSTETHSIW